MKLNETIELMTSADYKDRFKAEYLQLKVRRDGLNTMINIWDNGTLEFKPTCDHDMFTNQLTVMDEYLNILEKRALIENIEL